MGKRLTIWGGILIILSVLSQVLLPAAAERGIARAVGELAGAREVSVDVDQFPAVLMLAGRFDRVAVEARDVRTERVAFASLSLLLEGARIDAVSLLRGGPFAVRAAENIALRAVISEASLAELINRRVKGAKDAAVRITPERTTVRSTLSLGKLASAAVELEGQIVVSDNRIAFTTERLRIDNPLLGKLGGAVFTELVLADFRDLPLDVQVKKVAQAEGEVVVEADNHR